MRLLSGHIGAIAALAMMASPAMSVDYSRAIEMPDGPPPPKKAKSTTHTYSRIRGRMPHIGAKERARHAGKPDGPMHGLPPLFRA